jgi:uncharacterized membrane protein YeaQ/YmgE (transglycosylase-associated protein family)
MQDRAQARRAALLHSEVRGVGIPTTPRSGKGEGAMIGAIVLGIVAGYLGRLLMPGRDKMGFIATMLLGLAGSVIGFLVFTELLGVGDNEMFDLGGLIGAIVGVMVLLALYRAVLKDKEHPLAR